MSVKLGDRITITLTAAQWAIILRAIDTASHPADAAVITAAVRSAIKEHEAAK